MEASRQQGSSVHLITPNLPNKRKDRRRLTKRQVALARRSNNYSVSIICAVWKSVKVGKAWSDFALPDELTLSMNNKAKEYVDK